MVPFLVGVALIVAGLGFTKAKRRVRRFRMSKADDAVDRFVSSDGVVILSWLALSLLQWGSIAVGVLLVLHGMGRIAIFGV